VEVDCLSVTLRRLAFAAVILVSSLIGLQAPPRVARAAVGGIGMSGSFYTFNGITIPQGGFINTTEMYIVVFSFSDVPVKVNLSYSAPPFIKVEFWPGNTTFTLPPRSYRKVFVTLRVAGNAIPGSYRVAVTATMVSHGGPPGGIIVQPSATQMIRVRITGKSGIVHIYALDPSNRIARNALVRLYMIINGTLMPVMDSYNGEIHTRIAPGQYVVRVYLSGELSGQANFTVEAGVERSIDVHLRIVYFEFFSVKPVISRGKILAARIHAIIKNVYKTFRNATVVLEVMRNNVLIERRTVMSASTIVLGRNELKFDYVPPEGWRPGNYTFVMSVYGFGGKLLAKSNVEWVYVPQPLWRRYLWLIAAGITGLAVLLSMLITARRRRRSASTKRSRQEHS
jgi:hypothetical protein